jgi:hypothetical protein
LTAASSGRSFPLGKRIPRSSEGLDVSAAHTRADRLGAGRAPPHGRRFPGDGNGFKLGGSDSTGPAAAHVVTNSMSFGNAATGFTDNGNTGALVITRDTAYQNAKTGFDFDGGSTSKLTADLAVGNATPVALGQARHGRGRPGADRRPTAADGPLLPANRVPCDGR